MKTILYTLFFLSAISFVAKAQSKFDIIQKKKSLMMPPRQNQNFKILNDKFRIRINPYWQEVDAPHTRYSYVYQVKVPCYNVIWGAMAFNTAGDANRFLRTVNGGKTWLFSSVTAPDNFALGSISAINGNTCYATVYDVTDYKGGGVYKTTDGGTTWKQLGTNQLSLDNSFVDFVYFFDAKKGIVVADNDGTNTKYLTIYTTCDAGKTWQRVPKKFMQPTIGSAYSSNFDVYAVLGNTIWVKGFDDQGNNFIFRSDDLGVHWQTYLFNITGKTYHGLAFSDKQNGLMVGFEWGGPESFLAATHDGGKTWAEVNNYTGTVMGLFVTVIPGTHTYVSTTPPYVAVYGSSYSRDGGKTWKVIDSGDDKGHSSIEFLNPFYGWTGRGGAYDGDPNGGMFKWKLRFSLSCDDLASDNSNNAADASVSKIDINSPKAPQLFPNPAKDKVVIQSLNPSLKTTLSLFNISGRLIQQANSTSNSYQFNIQKLPAGTYYIKVETGAAATTLKFVKE